MSPNAFTFVDRLFNGWSLWVYLMTPLAALNAALCVPVSLARAKSHPSWGLALLISSLAGGATFLAWAGDPDLASWILFGSMFGIPQVVSYIATQRRPKLQPQVAFALSLGILVVWMLAGLMLGATPD